MNNKDQKRRFVCLFAPVDDPLNFKSEVSRLPSRFRDLVTTEVIFVMDVDDEGEHKRCSLNKSEFNGLAEATSACVQCWK